MTETHLVYWELFPTIDHIYPIARGGRDQEENWLTTSMLKNSAKSNWTLDEIGWTIKEPGKLNDWDGLTNLFISLVNKDNSLLADKYIKKWYGALMSAQLPPKIYSFSLIYYIVKKGSFLSFRTHSLSSLTYFNLMQCSAVLSFCMGMFWVLNFF